MRAISTGPRTAPPAAPAGGREDAPRRTGRLLLEQAFGPRSLCLLRAAVQAHAAAARMPETRAEDLALVVHELAANAIQHGAGHGRLLMWHRDRALICQVDDDGPPTQPHHHPASPSGNTAARWPRAQPHGLWLVRALADRMSITSGTAGTRATAAFTLPAVT
jgi:anti-sigma regulatory factor (Ser/Thr protein kinase)